MDRLTEIRARFDAAGQRSPEYKASAAFIAHAPGDIAWLLDALTDARYMLAQAVNALAEENTEDRWTREGILAAYGVTEDEITHALERWQPRRSAQTMPERVAEIRARLAAATAGPREWRVWSCGDEAITGPDNTGFIVNIDEGTAEADATLITHAPADLAWLLAELERLHAALEARA